MIDSIQKILIEGKYKEPITSNRTKLIERQNGMEVNIVELRKEGLKIHIDINDKTKFKFYPKIINNTGGHKMSCDYLILLPNSSGTDVYFIEMKKTIRNTQDYKFKEACDQILATVPIWDYLVSMVKIHCDKKLNTDNIKKHFVVIAKRKSNKPIKPDTKDTEQRDNRKFKGENFALRYSPKGTSLSVQYLKCPTPS